MGLGRVFSIAWKKNLFNNLFSFELNCVSTIQATEDPRACGGSQTIKLFKKQSNETLKSISKDSGSRWTEAETLSNSRVLNKMKFWDWTRTKGANEALTASLANTRHHSESKESSLKQAWLEHVSYMNFVTSKKKYEIEPRIKCIFFN